MTKEEAEALSARVHAQYPYLTVTPRPSVEVFESVSPDDTSYICWIGTPGETVKDTVKRMSRIIEDEDGFESFQR